MKSSWKDLFKSILDEIDNLPIDLDSELLCPHKNNIFRCFEYFDVLNTKVIICGQDPYHTYETANGLAFDSENETPPSLKNILKEVKRTYPNSTLDLKSWAKQGVLLLNRALTVKLGSPKSHTKHWRPITNKMIKLLNDYSKNNDKRLIFILWGNDAKELKEFIDIDYHFILEHTHPSPLSRKPFIGNDHFVKCNEHLDEKIIW
jgi:uracil-DNA glycosylase